MALQIIRNNIINVEADAIVNTANPEVAVGRGVDSAIYAAAGWEQLLEARKAIGVMRPGQAAYTPAFDLRAEYIIHTVGPAWRGGSFGERETVAECYRGSLKLAAELDCESIAFPLIATGTYGFPKDEALKIAIAEISSFLLSNEMEVMLVVYDKESFEVSGKLFSDIKTFIGDNEVTYNAAPRAEQQRRGFLQRIRRPAREPVRSETPEVTDDAAEEALDAEFGEWFDGSVSVENDLDRTLGFGEADQILLSESVMAEPREYPSPSYSKMAPSYSPAFPSGKESLKDRLEHLDKTFQEYLFMLIDRRGETDADVYKKANIDRKHFSKIRNDIGYQPSKKTALAFAIALELNLDETRDLLSRAGLALSPSITFDKIIEYCIETGNYDIYEINCILFKYGQPTLGA